MKVTKIKQQIKRINRFSIFIDYKYALSLSESELLDFHMKVGQDLKPEDLAKLNYQGEFSAVRNACFRLLSYRARSVSEIRDYLIRKNYPEEIITQVIDDLVSKAYLDDEQFAKQWIENRLAIKHASIRQIKNELRQKKIDSSLISKLIDEQAIDETALIREVIEKKRGQSKYKDELKLMQYLSRKGFSYDKILVALGRRTE